MNVRRAETHTHTHTISSHVHKVLAASGTLLSDSHSLMLNADALIHLHFLGDIPA